MLPVSTLLLLFVSVAHGNPVVSAEQFLNAQSLEELEKIAEPGLDGNFYWQYPTQFQPDPDLGYRHSSSVNVRHIRRTVDKVIYDARYSFDEFGRRVSPDQSPEGQKSFIALSGCSYTFGHGLNDDETLSHYMNAQAQSRFTYNYGIGASGTHMSLALAESDRFKREIPMQNGTLIYVYMNAHIYRTNGFMNEISWLKNTPCYEPDSEGVYQRTGDLESCSPIRSWILLKMDALLRGTPFYRNFPKVRQSHIEKTCTLAAQTGMAFKKQYPDGQFFVFMHPMDSLGDQGDRMRECLDRRKIRYLRLKTSTEDLKNFGIPGDGHPNAGFNQRASAILLDYTRRMEDWYNSRKQQ